MALWGIKQFQSALYFKILMLFVIHDNYFITWIYFMHFVHDKCKKHKPIWFNALVPYKLINHSCYYSIWWFPKRSISRTPFKRTSEIFTLLRGDHPRCLRHFLCLLRYCSQRFLSAKSSRKTSDKSFWP